MAETTVPTNTTTLQPGRRALLGALAAAPVAAALPAMAAAPTVDPHMAWWAEWCRLDDYWAGPNTPGNMLKGDPLADRFWELDHLIMDTPAETMRGLAVQLRVLDDLIERGHAGYQSEWVALMVDTCERLAAGASVAT